MPTNDLIDVCCHFCLWSSFDCRRI